MKQQPGTLMLQMRSVAGSSHKLLFLELLRHQYRCSLNDGVGHRGWQGGKLAQFTCRLACCSADSCVMFDITASAEAAAAPAWLFVEWWCRRVGLQPVGSCQGVKPAWYT